MSVLITLFFSNYVRHLIKSISNSFTSHLSHLIRNGFSVVTCLTLKLNYSLKLSLKLHSGWFITQLLGYSSASDFTVTVISFQESCFLCHLWPESSRLMHPTDRLLHPQEHSFVDFFYVFAYFRSSSKVITQRCLNSKLIQEINITIYHSKTNHAV